MVGEITVQLKVSTQPNEIVCAHSIEDRNKVAGISTTCQEKRKVILISLYKCKNHCKWM